MNKISIVVSAYNESQGIEEFYKVTKGYLEELRQDRGYDYELMFVNDGSQDGTDEKLRAIAAQDQMFVRVIQFSRNFGHEAAMVAGLDSASGDVIVFMDADLQHPPCYIREIAQKAEEGYDVISMVRLKNESAGLIKNITSNGFYWLINKISDMHFEPSASDFFAITKKVQQVLIKNYRNQIRFLRGYVQNVGFRKTIIEYVADERIAGQSHYSLKKLMKFSLNTIMCFSDVPLKIGVKASVLSALLGLIVFVYSLFTHSGAPSGYTTIVVLLCFMFSLLFLVVGIIGEYIATIFAELKDRPIYIVDEKVNFEEP